jgi:sucrose-6-phosphate hydrolase SacC (GH32 family)
LNLISSFSSLCELHLSFFHFVPPNFISISQSSTMIESADMREAERCNLSLSGAKSLPQRPSFHITAPWGWMNDPCAPGYDSTTGLYHLFYQCKTKPQPIVKAMQSR